MIEPGSTLYKEMLAVMKKRSKPGNLGSARRGQEKVPESSSTLTADSLVDATSQGEGNPPDPVQSLEELSLKLGDNLQIMRANESLGSGPNLKISINGGQEREGSLSNLLLRKDYRGSPEEGRRRDYRDHKQRLRSQVQISSESAREIS